MYYMVRNKEIRMKGKKYISLSRYFLWRYKLWYGTEYQVEKLGN